MDKGIEIIIVCAVLAAAVVGVGIFLTVHFCRQRRKRRQQSPYRSGYGPPSGARGERQRRRPSRQAAGRTRSRASRNGGSERPLPPTPAPLQPAHEALRLENCWRWVSNDVGVGRALVDVHQPAMSLIAASEVSNVAATLNYSHTYQTVPDDPLRCGVDELALEVDACEPPQSPPPPPPSETRQQRKERELRRTQELFPGVPVKEEQVYELRAIFSEPQLPRLAAAGVPPPGASALPHPSSAPPWPTAAVHDAAPATAAASAGVAGEFRHWPTTTAREATPISLIGPVLTDGGGCGAGCPSDTDTVVKQPLAPSQKTGLTHGPPHGSGSAISGIVFSADVANSTATTAAAKQRYHPNPPAQTHAPDYECRLPDGSPPRATDCRTFRTALGKSPPVQPPPPPPRPVSVAICGLAGGDARTRGNADLEQRPVAVRMPDFDIGKYLHTLPAERLEQRCTVSPADGGRAAMVTVATEEYAGSEQPAKPYCLLGPNSLRTS